jgi:hypothetical protein
MISPSAAMPSRSLAHQLPAAVSMSMRFWPICEGTGASTATPSIV